MGNIRDIRRGEIVVRKTLSLLPPHEQLEDLQESKEHSQWIGQTLFVILENGYQFMGVVIQINDTHIVTDGGSAKKENISFVRAMKADEIAIRKGLPPR